MEEIIIQYLPTGLTAILSLVVGIITKMLTKKIQDFTKTAKDARTDELKALNHKIDVLIDDRNKLEQEVKELRYKVTAVKED